MTAELTFVPGRVPGIAKTPSRAPIAQRGLPHAAAPRSMRPQAVSRSLPEEAAPGMTLAQRRALAALIHVPAGRSDAPFGRTTVAWITVLAGALAWTLAIVAELAPDARVAAGDAALATRIAMPHVVETQRTA